MLHRSGGDTCIPQQLTLTYMHRRFWPMLWSHEGYMAMQARLENVFWTPSAKPLEPVNLDKVDLFPAIRWRFTVLFSLNVHKHTGFLHRTAVIDNIILYCCNLGVLMCIIYFGALFQSVCSTSDFFFFITHLSNKLFFSPFLYM